MKNKKDILRYVWTTINWSIGIFSIIMFVMTIISLYKNKPEDMFFLIGLFSWWAVFVSTIIEVIVLDIREKRNKKEKDNT